MSFVSSSPQRNVDILTERLELSRLSCTYRAHLINFALAIAIQRSIMASANISGPSAQDSTGANDAPHSTNPPNSPPPSKQSLNHWWKAFSKKNNKKDEEKGKLHPTNLESGNGGDGVYTLFLQSQSPFPGLSLNEGCWGPSSLEQPALHPNHHGAGQALSSLHLPVAIANNTWDLKAHVGDSQGVRRLSEQITREIRGSNGHLPYMCIKNTLTSLLLPETSLQPIRKSFADSPQAATPSPD